VGIGVLVLVETLFPPIPSEVILPLGGYLAERGRLDLALVLLAATAASMLGSLLLYSVGARAGRDASVRGLGRLPLLEPDDVERAFGWFDRYGPRAVLLGRLVPGVRSLVSLPAGAAGMPLPAFCLLTFAGSAAWNGLLIGAGYALGTQYELVERYTGVLDTAVYLAAALGLGYLLVRGLRRRRASPPAR
jgi:membrane protein DedA with SNARE-associated domain